MSAADYEYRGLMAQAWDVLRGDTSRWEDRFFYRDVIQRYGQPALDVGCGTGRLLLDYLAQGLDIDGLDNSPEMLALCRRKAAAQGLQPRLYEQAMETLELPRRYRTILIPSSSLQLVIDPSSAAQALTRLAAHLTPGGVLAAPLMTLWRAGDPLESEWEKTVTRPEDGAQVRRVARAWYDPATECEATEDLYQISLDGRVVQEETHRRSPATRSYTPAQGRALFEQAGLVEVQVYHGFTFEPLRPDDTLFTVLGRRAEA